MSSTPPSSQLDGAESRPLLPPRLADHELLRRIGRGAYGEVWLARCALGTYRAIKIVHRQSFDHDRPFEREFEGIRKFEPISRTHNSQVNILHVGRGDDYFYYVMELADDQDSGGQINPDSYAPRSLKSDLQVHGRLSFEECVRIGIALATALEHLHDNGLVHRDVKPSNIIFVNGVPKLADIGLVTGIDATCSYVGTEGFAAPEGPGTAQADLFGFGKVLYEAATGKDRQEFPELPTNLRALPDREGLAELNAVIAKACRHNPRDRYANAAAMRADLELLQSGKSLARLHRVERRLRVISRIGIAVTVLVMFVLAAWLYQRAQTHEATRLAAENKLLAEENRQRLVQMDTDNGIREMDTGDLGNAMAWFSDALKYATNDPADLEVNRVRLSMLLQLHPRPVAIIPLAVTNSDFIKVIVSRNGQRMLTLANEDVDVWDVSLPVRNLFHLSGYPMTNWAPLLNSDGERFVLSSRRPGESQLFVVSTNHESSMVSLPADLRDISFANDDRTIIGVLSNQVVVAMDGQSGRVVREVANFDSAIVEMQQSLDGNRAAVTLTNHLVQILDLSTGALVNRIQIQPENRIFLNAHGRFAVRYDGRYSGVISSANLPASQYQAQILDMMDGRPVGAPLRHENYIWHIGGSRSGKIVATLGADKTVRLWNQFTGDALAPPLRHSSFVGEVAFSPDDLWVGTGDADGNVQIFEALTGDPVIPRLRHHGSIRCVAFARDGAMLVTAATDGLVKLWEINSMRSIPLNVSSVEVEDIEFSQDGQFLVHSDTVRSRVWRVQDWSVVSTFKHAPSPFQTISSDGRYIATLEEQPAKVRVWSAQTGEPISPPLVHGTLEVLDASFSPDGQMLATAGSDGKVRFWDWHNGTALNEPLQHTGQVHRVRFSPAGDRILTMTSSSNPFPTHLWSVQGRLIGTERQGNAVPAIFSSDGSKFLWADLSYVRMNSAATGEPLSGGLGVPLHGIISLAFSPDGQRVASGDLDGTVQIIDLTSGHSMRLGGTGHGGDEDKCEFSKDGRILATTAAGYVRLWSATTGLPMTPQIPVRARRSALHPNGRMLALGLRRRVMVFNLAIQAPDALLPAMVQWTTDAKITADAKVGTLNRNEVLDLDEELRKQLPNLFTFTADQLAQWHESQIWNFGHLSSLESSLFHLERLLQLHPGDPAVRKRYAELSGRRVPPRDPNTPARLIDLTDYYTRSFDTLVGHELRGLPRGVHPLAGIDFDLRGLIVLEVPSPSPMTRRPAGMPGEYPQVSHIRIAQRCKRLHFLQAYHNPANGGDLCAKFIIHYADGSQRTKEMIYGCHLRCWWADYDAGTGLTDGVTAWQGSRDGGNPTALFKATWENPTPDVEITHLEFLQGDVPDRPILVAITAE